MPQHVDLGGGARLTLLDTSATLFWPIVPATGDR